MSATHERRRLVETRARDEALRSGPEARRVVVPPGASPPGRARDRVFHVCASMDDTVGKGLDEGKHVVTMRATLPGSSQVVMSSQVEVTLRCDGTAGDPPGAPPAGAPAAGGCSTGAGAGPWLGLAVLGLVRPARRRERAARRRT